MGFSLREASLRSQEEHALGDEIRGKLAWEEGLDPQVRRRLHPEIWRHAYDPDTLQSSALRPPDHVEAQFRSVFGDPRLDGQPQFKLRLHPLFKRWALFEYSPRLKSYQVVQVFTRWPPDAPADYLPADYRPTSMRHLWHLRGRMGDLRLPDQRDFEWLAANVDRARFTADEVEANMLRPQEAAEREAKRQLLDLWQGMVDDDWQQIVNDANRRAGSGQRLASYATIDTELSPAVFEVERRNGWTLKARHGTAAAAEIAARRRPVVTTDEFLRGRRRNVWEWLAEPAGPEQEPAEQRDRDLALEVAE